MAAHRDAVGKSCLSCLSCRLFKNTRLLLHHLDDEGHVSDGDSAVAIDVGNPSDIHPKAKLFVGERLALWALAKDYGKDIVCSGPLVKGAAVEPAGLDADFARVRVSFDYVGSGLMAGKKDWKSNAPVEEDSEAGGKLKGFALQGADGKWHWANAVIEGKDVLVSSPEAPEPVAVRYAFRANPLGKCNLYNKEGLPASPFHLDLAKQPDEAK